MVPTPASRRAQPAAARAAREAADVALLTGPAGGELLRAVLGAEGVELTSWAVHQVHHRPGVGVTVGWVVEWRLGEHAGSEYLLASTAAAVPTVPVPDDGVAHRPPGVTTARVADRDVVVWRHPADPALPGLARATSAEWVGEALAGAAAVPAVLELVTYRPLRRAVLRARVSGRPHYLKVVRPHVAADLHARHELLAAAGLPVPRAVPLGAGVLALDALDGTSLAAVLAGAGPGRSRPPGPSVVTDLLDRLPATVAALPARPSPADRLADHAAAAVAVLPDRAGDVARLTDGLAELLATTDGGPTVPTHGDLNPANLLLAGGAVVGLLDVDTAGPGRRADDLAGLVGHLSVLPALAPGRYDGVPALLRDWTRAFGAQVDPVGLRARSAAVALSLVAGAAVEAAAGAAAARAQALARLGVARRWEAAARSLRDLSSGRPRRLMHARDGGDHRGRRAVGALDEGGRG